MQYRVGTVNVTAGSATVTGVGTQWLNQIQPGHIFVRARMISGQRVDDVVYYTVASVASNTSLTLTAPYQGPSGTGQPYGITRELTPAGKPLLAPQSIGSVAVFNGAVVGLEADAADAKAGADASLKRASNLSDLTNAATARQNLGLGTAAVANIVGTVSQSGGTPTGAIIQRGSNPNGEFVRYADGTMICYRSFDTVWDSLAGVNHVVSGGVMRLLSGDFSLPSIFVSVPANPAGGVRNVIDVNSVYASIVCTSRVNTTAWQTVVLHQIGSTTINGSLGLTLSLTAIGRWF